MTLVHSCAILSIEKISYLKSSSSHNLKLSIIDTSLYGGTIVPRSNLYWVTRKIELTFASDQWSSRCNGFLYIYFCPHQRLITLRFTAELRQLSRFATKMTLVHSCAILSIEKISYLKSSSSHNLKLSIIDTSLYGGTIVPRSNLYWVTRKIELTFASDQWSSRCNGFLYIYFCPHQRLITLRFTAIIWGAL